MAFFEEVDELGIVEQHIQSLQRLEEGKSKDLLRTYREVRRELRDRLDTLPGDTFTAQRLRGVLLQVETAIAAMGDGLKRDLNEAGIDLGTSGVDQLVSEIKKFSRHFEGAVIPINVDALAIATDTNNFLINQKEASIDAYSEDVRQLMVQQITQASLEQISLAQLTQRIGRFFLGEEWKLLRIGRTELHNIYNVAKMKGMNDIKDRFLPDLKKTLIHPIDSRTGEDSKKLARENPIIEIDKPFKFSFKGKERVFMAPPDRPNDRAILVPVREAWT